MGSQRGVVGLADRVKALDGRMRVSSPAGGPTLLHVEVPCRFAGSWPRTPSCCAKGWSGCCNGSATRWWRRCVPTDQNLIVTDVRMPPSLSDDGLRSPVALRQEFPRLPALVLSQYVERS